MKSLSRRVGAIARGDVDCAAVAAAQIVGGRWWMVTKTGLLVRRDFPRRVGFALLGARLLLKGDWREKMRHLRTLQPASFVRSRCEKADRASAGASPLLGATRLQTLTQQQTVLCKYMFFFTVILLILPSIESRQGIWSIYYSGLL